MSEQTRLTARRVLRMPYGTPQQMAAADQWYRGRFLPFMGRHENGYEAYWGAIHNTDVFYQARRRWFAVTGETEVSS